MKNSFILLENIRLFAHHGVLAQETKVGNYFTVTVKLKIDVSKAAETDSVNDTISYADVYDIIREEMEIPSKLLEHAAKRMIDRLKREFSEIEEVELKLSKLNPPMGADLDAASVMIID